MHGSGMLTLNRFRCSGVRSRTTSWWGRPGLLGLPESLTAAPLPARHAATSGRVLQGAPRRR
jgi:hypothetical protein